VVQFSVGKKFFLIPTTKQTLRPKQRTAHSFYRFNWSVVQTGLVRGIECQGLEGMDIRSHL
jgi:hypothetical protein